MYEEYVKTHALIFTISGICALIAAFLILLWFISLFVLSQPDPQNSIEEKILFVVNHPVAWVSGPLIMFLYTLIQIPIIIGLFLLTKRLQYFGANLGGIMGLIYIIFCSQTYFRLFTAIPRLARIYATCNNELEKYVITANFNGWGHLSSNSLAYNLDVLGYTFLGLMCILFGINLVSSIKLRTLTGCLLLISGFLSILGIIGYIIRHPTVEMGILAFHAVYFIACVVMYPMFHQETQILKATAGKG